MVRVQRLVGRLPGTGKGQRACSLGALVRAPDYSVTKCGDTRPFAGSVYRIMAL